MGKSKWMIKAIPMIAIIVIVKYIFVLPYKTHFIFCFLVKS